jgi:Phosphodiester glycosidase
MQVFRDFGSADLRRCRQQEVKVECPPRSPVYTSAAHVVTVDLTAKGVSLAALSAAGPSTIVPPIPRTFLISDALQQTRALVAINANLFTECCTYDEGMTTGLLGLAYTNHTIWSPIGNVPRKPTPPPGNFLSSLIVADGRVGVVTLKKGQNPPPGLTLAVTGTHRILTDARNTAPTDTSPSWFGPTARTVVRYSVVRIDKQQLVSPHLWLVAIDASNGSDGVTLPQAADLLLSLGATDAINLDGGGSTSMVRQEPNGAFSFINTSKDWAPKDQACRVAKIRNQSCERYVDFGLAVVAPLLP